jgi:cyclophilin family peptidyl-prolyl cis-trans isomerase
MRDLAIQKIHCSTLPTKSMIRRILPILSCILLVSPAVAQEKKAEEKKPEAAPAAKVVKVALETSKGTIELELDAEKAPISVENFVSYVKKGHYDGTIFHRVIPTFMIQGGGFTPDLQQKPTDAPIENESKNGLKNAKGTIAMARTREPNSATSQFFINVEDNTNLDYPSFDGFGYAVFGKVSKGLEVVEAIKGVETEQRMGPEKAFPVEPILIKSAKVLE